MREPTRPRQKLILLAASAALAVIGVTVTPSATAAGRATQYPYTLIDPGTLGGPLSFLNQPGIPVTNNGILLGTADTSILDADYPNFNPFMVGFPDQYLTHGFEWQNGHLTDLGALPGNNSSAVFQVNGNGVGAGMSENGISKPSARKSSRARSSRT
jgi:hypothetical protein